MDFFSSECECWQFNHWDVRYQILSKMPTVCSRYFVSSLIIDHMQFKARLCLKHMIAWPWVVRICYLKQILATVLLAAFVVLRSWSSGNDIVGQTDVILINKALCSYLNVDRCNSNTFITSNIKSRFSLLGMYVYFNIVPINRHQKYRSIQEDLT